MIRLGLAISDWIGGRFGFLLLEKFPPIVAYQLDGVGRADGSVAAAEVVSGAHFFASPADAFGVRGMGGEFGHCSSCLSADFNRASGLLVAKNILDSISYGLSLSNC